MSRTPNADLRLAAALSDIDATDAAAGIDALRDGAHVETPVPVLGLTPPDTDPYELTPLAAAAILRLPDPAQARLYRERIMANLIARGADVSASAVRLQMLAVDAHHADCSSALKRAVDGLVTLTQHLARSVDHAPHHDAGSRARMMGTAFLANPHLPETASHAAWVRGWTEADRSLRTGLLPDETPGRG